MRFTKFTMSIEPEEFFVSQCSNAGETYDFLSVQGLQLEINLIPFVFFVHSYAGAWRVSDMVTGHRITIEDSKTRYHAILEAVSRFEKDNDPVMTILDGWAKILPLAGLSPKCKEKADDSPRHDR